MNNLHKLLLLLVVTISIGISIFSLATQSIRLDEAQSIWSATKSVPMILKISAEDVNAPLYLLLLHFWIQVLGTDIVMVRILSLIFFLLTLLGLYFLAKQSANSRVAVLTIALFALSPFIVWYSAEARTYTLLALTVTTSSLFFLQLLRSGGREGKIGYFLATVAGLYTHYFFGLLLASQLLFVVYYLIIISRKATGRWLDLTTILTLCGSFIIKFLLIISAVVALFAPWVMYFLSLGGASNTQPQIPPPTTYNIIQLFITFLFGFQSNGLQSLLVTLWPISILVFFFIFTRKDRNYFLLEYFPLTIFLPVLLVFMISFIKPVFLPRYLIIVTPAFFFILAFLIYEQYRKAVAVLVILLAFLMFGASIYQSISSSTPVKENYQAVNAYLQQTANPHDVIAVTSPFTIYPIEYYYHGVSKIDTIPFWDRYTTGAIPPYSDTELEKQLTGYTGVYDNLYLVLSYDQGYESQIRQYLDSHYALLDHQQFSPGLEVRKYQITYK